MVPISADIDPKVFAICLRIKTLYYHLIRGLLMYLGGGIAFLTDSFPFELVLKTAKRNASFTPKKNSCTTLVSKLAGIAFLSKSFPSSSF